LQENDGNIIAGLSFADSIEDRFLAPILSFLLSQAKTTQINSASNLSSMPSAKDNPAIIFPLFSCN